MRRWILPVLLMFVLSACRLPSIVPQVPAGGTYPAALTHAGSAPLITGQIERDPTLQAEFEDFTQGATVALIDTETGLTLGTSLTTSDRKFILSFGENFAPVAGRLYYLDLLKGLQAQPGGKYNQAGADALRLRNVLRYDAATASWQSLLNATPGRTINISNKSTALSVALALKRQAGQPVDFVAYMGAVAGEYPDAGIGTLDKEAFTLAYNEVKNAIAKDSDPLQYIVYDANNNQYLGSLVLFSITDVFKKNTEADPVRVVEIGNTIVITGTGFTAPATVSIGPLVARVFTPSDTIASDRLEVVVPPGARTGPVSLQIEDKVQFGRTLTVKSDDGHRVTLGSSASRKLYAVNPEWNTVSEIDPSGTVRTLWDKDRDNLTDLTTPRQVAVRDGKIYVANEGSGKILRFDPATPGLRDASYIATVPGAHGLAFDASGALFVASKSGGRIVKLDASGSELASYPGFSSPIALAFDYNNHLFVVQEGGTIVKVTAFSPLTLEDWASVSKPRGIAVDSAGFQFVSSNDTDVVLRLSRTKGMVSVHAMVNSPGGVAFDEDGNLYVSDTEAHLVSRISAAGNLKVIAYGINTPRGIAVDPANPRTLYVSLGQSNAILRAQPDSGTLAPFVTGIANPMSLNFRGNGMFVAHPETGSVSFITRTGQVETVATNRLYPGGAVQEVDAAGNRTGPLYVARFGDQENGSSPRVSLNPNVKQFAIRGLVYGDDTGVDILQAAQPSGWHRWLYHQRLTHFAADHEGNLFLLNGGEKTLVMFSKFTSATGDKFSRDGRQLVGPKAIPEATFAGTPGPMTVDPRGNLYVIAPAPDGTRKVYRFVKARNYVMEEIGGFNNPTGLAASDATDAVVIFVADAGAQRIYRISDADNSDKKQRDPDDDFSLTVTNTVKAIAYMPGETAGNGTGTLYFSRANHLDYAPLTAHAPGAVQPLIENLPRTWAYMSARKLVGAGKGELYGFINSTFMDRVTLTPTPVFDTYADGTGSGNYQAQAFTTPPFQEWRVAVYSGGISSQSDSTRNIDTIISTREVELDPGRYLYVASPDTYSGQGGVLRIDLTTQEERYVRLRTYSLGLDTRNDDLYMGSYESSGNPVTYYARIYKMAPSGKVDRIWSLGTNRLRPYGLDVYTDPDSANGSRVWAAIDDSTLFEGEIVSKASRFHRLGLKAPVF